MEPPDRVPAPTHAIGSKPGRLDAFPNSKSLEIPVSDILARWLTDYLAAMNPSKVIFESPTSLIVTLDTRSCPLFGIYQHYSSHPYVVASNLYGKWSACV